MRPAPASALKTSSHRIIFDGINLSAACEMLLIDPPLFKTDPDYVFYKCEIIRNAQQFFLAEPNRVRTGVTDPTKTILRALVCDLTAA